MDNPSVYYVFWSSLFFDLIVALFDVNQSFKSFGIIIFRIPFQKFFESLIILLDLLSNKMDLQGVTILKAQATAFLVFFGKDLSLLKHFDGEPWFDKNGHEKKLLLPDNLFIGNWLQASYSDAFGNVPPRGSNKLQTFRNGGGNFLAYSAAIAAGEPTNRKVEERK